MATRDTSLTISLLLNARQAEDVFEDKTRIKEDYQELARACHPDLVRDPHAKGAMQRLVEFRKEALDKIEHNLWGFCAFREPSYEDDLGPVFKHKQDLFITGPEAIQKLSYGRWSDLVSPKKWERS